MAIETFYLKSSTQRFSTKKSAYRVDSFARWWSGIDMKELQVNWLATYNFLRSTALLTRIAFCWLYTLHTSTKNKQTQPLTGANNQQLHPLGPQSRIFSFLNHLLCWGYEWYKFWIVMVISKKGLYAHEQKIWLENTSYNDNRINKIIII